MLTRRFLYLDLDAFFCCCEILRDRSLLTVPFAVGGSPHHRGVVSSASYPARVLGVRSGIPMSRAVRLCPELKVIHPHFDDYQLRSREVMAYLHTLAESVEQRSVDEAVLDITDLPDDAVFLAETIQATIRHQFRLPCSLGIASSITVSKIAVEVGKKRGQAGKVPQAITIVPAGTEATFLAPLPVGIMPGIGPKLEQSLRSARILTLGGLATWPLRDLQHRFGDYAVRLQQRAVGRDTSVIASAHQRKAISQEHTFADDITDTATLLEALHRQAEQVSTVLQRKHLYATVVKMKLRWDDFTTLTRQMPLPDTIDTAAPIFQAAQTLLAQTWDTEHPIRLIGVGVGGLQTMRQLRLWEPVAGPEGMPIVTTR